MTGKRRKRGGSSQGCAYGHEARSEAKPSGAARSQLTKVKILVLRIGKQ